MSTLQKLTLSGCTQVSDDAMQSLACLTALTYLDLDHCDLIGHTGLRVLVAGARTLRRLSIAAPALLSLNVMRCSLLRDAGLRELTALTTLTFLATQGCQGLPLAAVRSLAEHRVKQRVRNPALQLLNVLRGAPGDEDGAVSSDGTSEMDSNSPGEWEADYGGSDEYGCDDCADYAFECGLGYDSSLEYDSELFGEMMEDDDLH